MHWASSSSGLRDIVLFWGRGIVLLAISIVIGSERKASHPRLDNRLVIGFCDHPVRRGLTENKDDFSLVGKISSNYF